MNPDDVEGHERTKFTEVNVLPILALMGIALVAILMFNQYATDSSNSTSLAALLSLAFGCTVYVAHGSGRVTALGLFNLALAMFVGLGGFAGRSESARVSQEWLLYAIILATAMQALVTIFCWRSIAPQEKAVLPSSAEACRRSAILGAFMMIVVALAQRSGNEVALGYFGEGVGFVGAMLIICPVFLRPSATLVSAPTVVALASLAVYATVIHQGTGRLRIVALACAFLMVGSARFPRRALKVASLAALPVALWWLARDRLNYQESLEQGASEGRTGLESMFSPITTLAQVMEAQASGWPLEWGHTFLSIPFIIVPDSVMDAPAPAIGYDLVRLTEPGRVGTGFSEASTVFGEWVWNFGVWGPLLLVPIAAVLIGWLDRRFSAALTNPHPHEQQRIIAIAFWATLGGTVADLAWSGFHTFVTRILTRGPAFLVLYLLFRVLARTKNPTVRRGTPPTP